MMRALKVVWDEEEDKGRDLPLLSCKPYRALLTPHACRVNIEMARAAESKWNSRRRWDVITDPEWERWMICSKCERSGMDPSPAYLARKEVGWEAWEVLTTVYADDGRTGRKGPHRTSRDDEGLGGEEEGPDDSPVTPSPSWAGESPPS